jgi:hypothetical protein
VLVIVLQVAQHHSIHLAAMVCGVMVMNFVTGMEIAQVDKADAN